MQIIQLTSLDHPGLDVYARLTEAQLRRRLEPEQGVFIAESPKVIATRPGRRLPAGVAADGAPLDRGRRGGDPGPLPRRHPRCTPATGRCWPG